MYHEFRRPTILVIGATGAQGGGVARHLLADGRWTVRALTRNPQSSAARTLRDAGVEIAVGDLDVPSSLRRAMVMCHGVHGIASVQPHRGQAHRGHALPHGLAIVDAAAAANVKHLVLQFGADTPLAPQQRWARLCGVPTTFVRAAFHYEHLLHGALPRPAVDEQARGAGGTGDAAPLAAVSAEDVGGVVAAIFARRREHVGRPVAVVCDVRPAHESADVLARTLGRPVTRGLLSFPPHAADTPSSAWPAAAADLEASRRLFPRLRTFEQWARVHARELARGVAALEAETRAA